MPMPLGSYARRVNPLLRDLLAPMQYYWVTAQCEYSTGACGATAVP